MKKFTFSNTTPLTADHFNSFVQESQIMQRTGDSRTDVMSQAAVTNALRSLGYSDGGYGYGYDTAAAVKGICVHAKGKVDGNVIVVCAENVLNTVTLGTTVTVTLQDAYLCNTAAAQLRAGGVTKDIIVRSGINGSSGIRKIYYAGGAQGGDNDIRSYNVFMKGASYEFCFDGEYWELKNYVVSSGKNHRIWADGYTERWGTQVVGENEISEIGLGVNFSGCDYSVSLGAYSGADNPNGGLNRPALGILEKQNNRMHIFNNSAVALVYWHACGY